MRSAALTSHLQSREGLNARQLVWVAAKDRADGSPRPIGFWNGSEDISIEIDGAERPYLAGGLVSIAPIRARSDFSIQMQRITLAANASEVEEAFRARDIRLARIEVHVLHRHPVTGAFIDVERQFLGQVDKAPIDAGGDGQGAVVAITAASAGRMMTRGLPRMRSDEVQSRRGGDRFFQYASVGAVRAWWNQERPD